MKRVLITGGAGFVGRHFIKRFLNERWDLVCVDNLHPSSGAKDPKEGWHQFNPFDFKNFKFVKEDCRTYFQRESKTSFDLVLHLAAIVGGRLMIENHALAVAEDLEIDASFWRWALQSKPSKIICFSSSAAYPVHLQTRKLEKLLKESHIDFTKSLGLPDLSYGWAKLTCEYLAKLAFERYGLKSVIYRPFSGYGEDQDLSYPFPSLCQRVFSTLTSANKTVELWGSGEQSRDFIHIDDCVEAVMKTMDKIDNADALNLCTGVKTTFNSFVHELASCLNVQVQTKTLLDKPEGVFSRIGDPSKLKTYGYTYKTSLRNGFEYMIANLSAQQRFKKKGA